MTINQKTALSSNFGGSRSTSKIKYIVIHYTANRGDTAKNNADYFSRTKVGASAHFFVDENEVWNSVPVDRVAWHCGGGLQGSGPHPYFNLCSNSNSLGIEICMNDKKGAVRMGSINHAIELTKMLMKQYNVPVQNVIRHYDRTCKNCPGPMVADVTLWNNFKAALTKSTSNTTTPIEEDEPMKVYNYVPEMPEWARPTFTRLVQSGYVTKDASGKIAVQECSIQPMVYLDRLTNGKLEKLPDIIKALEKRGEI